MDALQRFKNLHYTLILLEEHELYIYDSVDELKKPIGLFRKGLQLDLNPDNLSRDYALNINELRILAETCLNVRRKLDDLKVLNDSPVISTLEACIFHVERIYDKCYGLRDFQIEKMQYEEKVYDLLIALGVYQSDDQFFGGYNHVDWDAKEQEKIANKLELINFAKTNLEEVIQTIHSWARENSRYNARIPQGIHTVILVHNLIKAAKKSRLTLD